MLSLQLLQQQLDIIRFGRKKDYLHVWLGERERIRPLTVGFLCGRETSTISPVGKWNSAVGRLNQLVPHERLSQQPTVGGGRLWMQKRENEEKPSHGKRNVTDIFLLFSLSTKAPRQFFWWDIYRWKTATTIADSSGWNRILKRKMRKIKGNYFHGHEFNFFSIKF